METLTTPDNPVAKLEALLRDHPQIAELFALLRPGDPRDARLVSEIVRLYLENAHEEVCERTLESRRPELRRFVAEFGERTVASMTPLEVKKWVQAQKAWRSPHTRKRANGGIQRVFNWALGQRLIRENYIRGSNIREATCPTGRDMKPDEFQAVMRVSDPYFRRFLVALRMTGARPGELSNLCWHHIDWEKSVAVLREHKTAHATGRPRVIYLTPQMVRLLKFIRREQHGTCAYELHRLLSESPTRSVRAPTIAKVLHREFGFSYVQIRLAKRRLGLIRRCVGESRRTSRYVYELPRNGGPPLVDSGHVFLSGPPPVDSGHVFRTRRTGCPWTRGGWHMQFSRLRKLAGLPSHCKIYGLRHFYISTGVKRGVNLKALAALVGHRTTRMIELIYCHVDEDIDFMHAAACQAIG